MLDHVEIAAATIGKLTEKSSFTKAIELAVAFGKEARDSGMYYPNDGRTRPGNSAAVGSFPDYLGRLAQFWDGDIHGVPNSPSALSSLLVMAPLGAGIGLAGGYMANKLTGDHAFNNHKANALMGALAGSVPGLIHMGMNGAAGKPLLTGDAFNAPMAKEALYSPSVFGPYIPVDALKDLIYQDPLVASQLPPTLQAATIGLVEGAQNLPGRRSSLPIVTPGDIGRMALGLGSGYASGVVVGKVLGGILGLDDTAKKMLRQSGAAAGLIKAVVPMAYGAF